MGRNSSGSRAAAAGKLRTPDRRANADPLPARAAERGWAVLLEEAGAGTASVAAPVRDRAGKVVGAVGVRPVGVGRPWRSLELRNC
ncbi:IclR family transcriptional regulator C-terminal domain-containing protein [Kitasatospora aureofaciens]|uniref:IclR family transcriptional regulator domain-containing protein n=1 Tax=Kitasatospora aureofaciens TaxID=1894 RepID=UPI0037FE324C